MNVNSFDFESHLQSVPLKIDYLDCVDSTNLRLRQLAEQGAPEGRVLIAAQQTAGRGRMGRSFYSPAGSGLYMSLLLRPKLPSEKAPYLTTCAAVAVASALEALSGKSARIKWVNDIYMRARKVCGILVESSLRADGSLNYAVLGVGVNLLEPKGGFPQGVENIAGAVFRSGDADALRATTADAILDRFLPLYATLEEKPFLEEYRRRSLPPGCEVTVFPSAGGAGERASVVRIDEEFSLIVRVEDGTLRRLHSGEVSVRPTLLA